jgi:hypothetical protein
MLCIAKGGKRACTSHAPSPWTGSIPAGKLGCHFRPVGRFGFKGSGAAFDGKKGGRLPSRLDCFAPTVGVSAGWIAERTRKITVKGQMRGSYAQIHAGNLSSWVPLYSPLLVAWSNPHASHPRRKNDLANACTSRPINLVSATVQIHPLVSLARWRC